VIHTTSFRTTLRFCALLAALVLAGCDPMGATKDATRAAQRHHELYDTERFGIMYSESDAGMKTSVTEAQFLETARMMRARMGTLTSTRQIGMNMSVTTGSGTQVQLVYQSQFTNGEATETLVFRVREGRARLLNWNLNSPAFLEPPAGADSAGADSAATDSAGSRPVVTDSAADPQRG
jgi:hypothetical protein